jgi:hypothetical protein
VAPYTLPDPLLLEDGTKVRGAAEWRTKRRPELIELFSREVYGRTPSGKPADMHWKVDSLDRTALGGKATRKEVTIWFSRNEEGPKMHLLVFQPNNVPAPRPVFLGLNFAGNQTVHSDPAITLSTAWVPNDPARHLVDHRGTEESRGADSSLWQIENVLARGYATATIYCGDLCPDNPDGLESGVAPLFAQKSGVEDRAPDAWGAVGVWAWGLSRALDYIENDSDLDAKRVALHGFSRLGKAANWAAAQDERFGLLISNESGCLGAALSKRIYGETVAMINAKFPHWFAKNLRRYDDNEAALPVDQHELLALIAPRPLYVASAEEDRWSDPRGEFLSAKFAEPVYRLLGERGLGVDEMPPLSHPVGEMIRYHIRPGKHGMTDYDWTNYLDFADRHLQRMDKTPSATPTKP